MIRAILLLLISSSAIAKDFGVRGEQYPILERDMIDSIKHQLSVMEASGKLAELQTAIQKRAIEQVKTPRPVDVTKALENKEFLYDASFVAPADIKDADGNIIYTKGYRVNPLEYLNMPSKLVFVDARDSSQLSWLKNIEGEYKLILTAGSPLTLGRELGRRVYFDQNGSLCERFTISHVPAIVEQKCKFLNVKEVAL